MWFLRFFAKKNKIYKKLVILECQIHGSHYYDCLNLVQENKLFIGDILILNREPTNEHDQYAIEVLTRKGKKLGYIPQKHSQVIASLIDHRCYLSAEIQSIFTTAWEPVNIQISLHFPR